MKPLTLNNFRFAPLYAALLLGVVIAFNLGVVSVPYYQRLADAFIHGRLDVSTNDTTDLAPFNGRYYYPDGPLPSILMTPLVAMLGIDAPIALVALVGNLGVFYMCFLLARRFDYSLVDACWFTLAFCFGTSFIGVIYLSWSFSHGLTVLCLFLAIAEYENKRRLLLIGLLIGLAMTSHAPAGLNIIFFVLAVLLGAGRIGDKSADLAKLLLPFTFIVGSLALYNFARFGSPLESGYSYQINGFGLPYADWNVPGNIAGPAVSLANIPTNLWTFLFGLPEAAAIGSSVFLLSPFAVYLATLRRWDMTNTLIVVNVVLVLAAVLAFRSTGFEQVGYRFSLDFLPFIFWLAVRSRLRVTPELRALIFFATLIDLGLVCYFQATRI